MKQTVTIISENDSLVNRIKRYWPGETRRISNWSDFETFIHKYSDQQTRIACLLDLTVGPLTTFISAICEAQEVLSSFISVFIWSTMDDIKKLEHAEQLSLPIDRLVEKPKTKKEFEEFIESLLPFFAEDQHKRIKIVDYNTSDKAIHGEFLTGENFVIPASEIRNPWSEYQLQFQKVGISNDRYCLTIPVNTKKTVDLPWDYIRDHYLKNKNDRIVSKKQMIDTQISVGKRIQELRAGEKLSQDQLAEKSGLARATVNRIEIGKTLPSLATLRKFAKVFNLSVTELLPS